MTWYKVLFSRFFIVILGIIIIIHSYVNFESIQNTGKISVLNRLRPNNIDLLVLSEKEKTLTSDQLHAYNNYLEYISYYMPSRSDAYGLRGLLHYHMNKSSIAIKYYHKAIQLNPYFFWYYYNLSIIYYEEGEYKKSALLLSQALKLPPVSTLRSIIQSQKVYVIIHKLYTGERTGIMLENELKQGYKDAKILLLKNYLKLKSPQKNAPKLNMTLGIF